LDVTFTDLSAPSATGWSWDFGDGQSSTDQNPTHQYAVDGTYSVSLTASNASGTHTQVLPMLITVPEAGSLTLLVYGVTGLVLLARRK
jgi:PKD repeat protein